MPCTTPLNDRSTRRPIPGAWSGAAAALVALIGACGRVPEGRGPAAVAAATPEAMAPGSIVSFPLQPRAAAGDEAAQQLLAQYEASEQGVTGSLRALAGRQYGTAQAQGLATGDLSVNLVNYFKTLGVDMERETGRQGARADVGALYSSFMAGSTEGTALGRLVRHDQRSVRDRQGRVEVPLPVHVRVQHGHALS